MKVMPPKEHAIRRATNNWSTPTNGFPAWRYPPAPSLPMKPWHPSDADQAIRTLPGPVVANSADIIDHIRRHAYVDRDRGVFLAGDLNIATPSVVPNYRGCVDGTRLNVARAGDPEFTVARKAGGRNLFVSTYWAAPYGAKVRIPDEAVAQGYPMNEYSDHKMHLFDVDARTITEIQFITEVRRNPVLTAFLRLFGLAGGYHCHTVSVTDLTKPSTAAPGASAAGISLVEGALRYDDLASGWIQMSTMAYPAAAKGKVVPPAKATDGSSDDPNAMKMGQLLAIRPDIARRLLDDPATPTQAKWVLRCWSTYGLMLVDVADILCTNFEPDERWDPAAFAWLDANVNLDSFEVRQLP